MITYSFPSVFEGHATELSQVSKDLLNGLKIHLNGDSYILGNLALSEGYSPHKAINSSPNEIDYHLFLYASLLLANFNHPRPITLTTGFPFSTYQINRNFAKNFIQKDHLIEYEASTFSEHGRSRINAEIQNVEILSEMQGNIIALRKGEQKVKGSFFMISLGYGTCEAVLSTEDGIVQRTAISVMGIQYALDLFINELSKEHYLGLKTKKQVDMSFQNDFIILNRKKVDIRDLKKRVLKQYYKDIVSPSLARAFNDTDFSKSVIMYITGGGALFKELTDSFMAEFDGIITVQVVDDPLTLTSRGYCLNSLEISNQNKAAAVGLDIGNSNTVLSQFNEGAFGWE